MAIRKPKLSAIEARRRSEESDVKNAAAEEPIAIEPKQKSTETNNKPAPSTRFAADNSSSTKSPRPPKSSSPASPKGPRREKQKQVAESGLDAFQKLDEQVEKMQVFLSADVPAPKVSKSYDMLSRRYQPAKALQMVLRRAMTQYEHMLVDGTFHSAPYEYEKLLVNGKKITVQTSRVMPTLLVDIATNHFDPLGFESTRSKGYMLGTAALAAFFATE